MSYSFRKTFGKWFFGLHFSLQLHAVVLLDTPGASQWNKHTKADRKCLPGRVKFIAENKISQKKGKCEGWAGLVVFNLEFLSKRHQWWKHLNQTQEERQNPERKYGPLHLWEVTGFLLPNSNIWIFPDPNCSKSLNGNENIPHDPNKCADIGDFNDSNRLFSVTSSCSFTSMTSSVVDCWASSRIPLTNCLLAAL